MVLDFASPGIHVTSNKAMIQITKDTMCKQRDAAVLLDHSI